MKIYMDCAVYRVGPTWIIRDLLNSKLVASYSLSAFEKVDTFTVIRLYRDRHGFQSY